MPKKSYNEKLNNAGDLPKVEKLTSRTLIDRYKTDTMVIASPVEYDRMMKKIPYGKITTIDRIMACMAKKHNAGCACPMTAGIFVNIAAHASEERGGKNETPWWRTLKKDGQLNEKFPEGIEGQKTRLAAEGHSFVMKGKRCLVGDYEEKLYRFR